MLYIQYIVKIYQGFKEICCSGVRGNKVALLASQRNQVLKHPSFQLYKMTLLDSVGVPVYVSPPKQEHRLQV